jgi:hypothetical protein
MILGLIGYVGLDTLKRAAFLRPVQIVRQSISNLGIGHISISTYHANKGLSSIPQNGGESRRITTIPIGITNPYVLISGYVAMRFDRNKV